MAVRRFGPVLGAGTQVEEQQGDQRIEPAPTGVTVMVGEFEQGPVGEPGFPAGKGEFETRYGGRIASGFAPQCALDFYDLGRGSGRLIPYRVTHGDEEKAEITLYTRQGTAAPPTSGRRLFGRIQAKTGGRWAGRRATYVDEITGAPDLTATTLDTGDAMIENEWAGGTLQLKKVTTKTYTILSNTSAGVISVAADQDLLTDWNAGAGTPANRYVLTRDNLDHLGAEQSLAIKVLDGEDEPGTQFTVEVWEDNALVKAWRNLSTDPASKQFWETVINDDPSNFWITAIDDYVGDATPAAVRPANFHGQSSALAATVLTLPTPDYTLVSPGGADPTILLGALGSLVRSQTIVGTVQNAGADISWVSTLFPTGFAVVQAAFTGVATDLGEELMTVTVTNGVTALSDGDTITIEVHVLVPDEAVGGTVLPDVVNEPNLAFEISANTRTTVSVRTGLDLTNGGAISAGEVFQLRYAQELDGGHDGSPVVDADYLPAFDNVSSTLKRIFGRNLGMVYVSTPGLVSTAVSKAALEFCDAQNFRYKVEIPANIVTESAAIDYINTTIGRSMSQDTHLPSFGYVLDPEAPAGIADPPLRRIPLIGQILGRQALVAYQFDGYHKTPAGIDVTLPGVLKLTTGGPEDSDQLDEELLNPKGINVVKFYQGSVIVWGGRTLWKQSESDWKWMHQRNLMNHYENLLRENYDWIVFALSNTETQERLATSIRTFFYEEFVKGALFSEKGQFEGDAFVLKIDSENNTAATRAAGDLNAEIFVRIVDTVERMRFKIGKAGIEVSTT